MQNNCINKLLNLKEVSVKNIINSDNSIKIFIETAARECICPACGAKTSKIHDYREQVIKDIPYMFKATYIVLRKRRYTCSCGKHFYENYDFLPRYHRMTTRLVQFVCKQLEDTISLKKIAKLSNLSTTTIARIVDLIRYSIPSFPEVVCIDEFKGNAETGKFQCILVDGKKHKILDILPDRTTSHLMDYFRKVGLIDYIGGIYLAKYLNIGIITRVMFFTINFYLMYQYAPSGTGRRPIGKKQYKPLKENTLVILSILFIVSIILAHKQQTIYANVVTIAMVSQTINVLPITYTIFKMERG